MSVRKYMYLITASEKDPDDVGKVEVSSKPRHGAEKNVERTNSMLVVDSGERYDVSIVGLGYYDFENDAAYREHGGEIVRQKLLEIDDQYLETVGIDPDDVREQVEA